MALRLGEIMEEVESVDHEAGSKMNPIPSWIRSHFTLEHKFGEFNERQRKLEEAIDRAANQEMEARSLSNL